MPVIGIPAQIKSDIALVYVSSKMKQFLDHYNIKQVLFCDNNGKS